MVFYFLWWGWVMFGCCILDFLWLFDEWNVVFYFLGFEMFEVVVREDKWWFWMFCKWVEKSFGKCCVCLLVLVDIFDFDVILEILEMLVLVWYMCDMCIWIIGVVWKVVDEDIIGKVVCFDVIKLFWVCDCKGLMKKNFNCFYNEFWFELNWVVKKVKFGGVIECDGFLFVFLYGEFEIGSK